MPSGLNATLEHRAGVARERRADRLPGVRVPHPHRVVVAAGGDALAVGAERHAAAPCPCGRSAARRSAGRCPRPTPAPSCRRLPETMRLPSGLNATLPHRAVVAGRAASRSVGRWPRPTPAPSSSALPEAIRLPSGLNATLSTAPVVAR